MKVYLAGPITGLTFRGCQDWRDGVKDELKEYYIDAVSPLRLKEFLDDGKIINGADMPRNWIVNRDRWDVEMADVVLANLAGATKVSLGTVSEITQARGNPTTFCIVVLPEGEKETNPHHHIFTYALVDAIVESLEEAVELIKVL